MKIADFGLSRLFNKEDRDKSYSPQVASRWYRPPELLWGDQKYTEKIDIWAAGCVFAEMLRGIALFNVSPANWHCLLNNIVNSIRLSRFLFRAVQISSNWHLLYGLWVRQILKTGPI